MMIKTGSHTHHANHHKGVHASLLGYSQPRLSSTSKVTESFGAAYEINLRRWMTSQSRIGVGRGRGRGRGNRR